MEFPSDRFKLYVKQADCPGSSELLAYMAGHPLPIEIVFLDFKARVKAIPAVEDTRDGSMKVGDEAIELVRHLSSSSRLGPELIKKTFVVYIHPRSPKSNQLMKLIAETSIDLNIVDMAFTDYVKGTPTLADEYERTVYNAEEAIESYKDIYGEFRDLKDSRPVPAPPADDRAQQQQQQQHGSVAGQPTGHPQKQFVSTNPKMLAMMGIGKPKISQMSSAGGSEAEGRRFQTEYDTDVKKLQPPPTAAVSHTKFVSSQPGFKHLMAGSTNGKNSVDAKKFQSNFETEEKTMAQLRMEEEQRRRFKQTQFVSSNPNHGFMEKLGDLTTKKYDRDINVQPGQFGAAAGQNGTRHRGQQAHQPVYGNSDAHGAKSWFQGGAGRTETAPPKPAAPVAAAGGSSITQQHVSQLMAQRRAIMSR